MSTPLAETVAAPDRRTRFTWLALAAVGWSGLAALGVQLASAAPPRAGFDLELLLVAGRRVAAGLSPYDAASSTATLAAHDLFYSYPPPLAQALSLVAAVPMPVALLALVALATAGLALVARLIGLRLAPDRPVLDVVLPALAVAPLVFPFAIATLFGNLDATFPFVYGLLLATALGSAGAAAPAGIVLAFASLAKLHPASLWLWFAVRRAPGARRTAGAAVVAGLAVVAASLALGGPAPWLDYIDVVRAGAAADLVDRRNVGPAAQIALALGGSNDLARTIQVPVSLLALAVTMIAARRRADPVESLAWAAVASLVTLPVTWFHYPVALIPFGLAAALRADAPHARAALTWLFAAGAVAAGAIAFPVAIWIAVVCLLRAVRLSAPTGAGAPLPAIAAPPTADATPAFPGGRSARIPSA